jgi:hypothetical protein
MEIKVKALGEGQEKSQSQQEQELLDKHEQKENAVQEQKTSEPVAETAQVEEKKVEQEVPVVEERKLSDEDIVSYLKEKHNKEITSVDELFREREENPLPEDVSAYLKYKKDTGRGFEDYVKLNRNFEDYDSDKLLREYLTETEEGLDREDIEDMMADYHFDDDIDDEATIKKTKLAKKRKIAEAKKYFNKQKEYFKQPLESSTAAIPEADLEKIKAYEQSIAKARSENEESARRRRVFEEKTNSIFSSEFKGFEFSLGDTNITYSPGTAEELKKAQSTPMNFVNKYIGEDGAISDAAGYHRALALAMNPEKFAKFFYEQGKSQATEDVMRKTKNINMSERKTPEVVNKGGMQIRSLSQDSGRGLKIKSIKRK